MRRTFYERMGLPEPRGPQVYVVHCKDPDGKTFDLKVEGTTIYDVKTKAIHTPGFRPGSAILSVTRA